MSLPAPAGFEKDTSCRLKLLNTRAGILSCLARGFRPGSNSWCLGDKRAEACFEKSDRADGERNHQESRVKPLVDEHNEAEGNGHRGDHNEEDCPKCPLHTDYLAATGTASVRDNQSGDRDGLSRANWTLSVQRYLASMAAKARVDRGHNYSRRPAKGRSRPQTARRLITDLWT